MKVELSTISKGIAKLKQFLSDSNTLNKKTYHSVLASLESLEPEFVQDEMPLGEINAKVDKLNRMLNERAANTVLSTLDYVNPLIESYLKEVPEQFNPEAFQTAKDKISQPFTTNPIPPFHTLSDMQRENVLNVVKKHFDLSDIPSIDLVNTLIEGYNAGAPKLNIARQANINFVVKQEFDIKEDDQRILNLRFVTFLKHRIRELFITMDKLKFDKSMGTDSLPRVINEFLNSGDCENLGRLKEIVATSSIINWESLESHETNLDKIHVENIPIEVMNCAKDIYSPGLKDIIAKLANSAKGDTLSELIEEHNHSIYLNNLFSLYVVFLDEINILTASIGLLAKVLKVNADVLDTATATINELDTKLDELFKELVEVTQVQDEISMEAFEWIKDLFNRNKFKISKLPETASELIALEQETLAKIRYTEQTTALDRFNKDKFFSTVKSLSKFFPGISSLKDADIETIKSWVFESIYTERIQGGYSPTLFDINEEYLKKLSANLKSLDDTCLYFYDNYPELKDNLVHAAYDVYEENILLNATVAMTIVNKQVLPMANFGIEKRVINAINIFEPNTPMYKLEKLYERYFTPKGSLQSYDFNFAKNTILSKTWMWGTICYIKKIISTHLRDIYLDGNIYGLADEDKFLIDYLEEELQHHVNGETKRNLSIYIDQAKDNIESDYLFNILIKNCLESITKDSIGDQLEYMLKTYSSYIYILLAYLEALKG